ncbi:hypothetical protein [Micromonospora sp. NPDC050200]|uniref:hypothetical protein n=1 Tax=Micromonospora sp. NPDC050200 TaxID=3155664 RepID=UPI0033CDFD75
MIPAEGSTDAGHSTPLVRRLSQRFGWWALLFGMVAAVGSWHVLVLVMNLLRGEVPPREFSLGGFALTWVMMAVAASLLEWWDRRSRRRRLEPPTWRWRDDTPRWLVVASPVGYVCWVATSIAAYMAAFDGELSLLWADALAGFAFALAAFVGHLAKRYKVPEDFEAVP